LKLAVIGAGHMGRYHAEKFARLPGVELAALVDRDPARAQISDFRKVLDRVQAAVIAVPTDRHHEVARACLERGVHVLVEKPIASTLEQADDLVALAKENRVVLQVGHVERYNKAFRALAQRMDRPLLIDAERLSGFHRRHRHCERAHRLRQRLCRRPLGKPRQPGRGAQVPRVSARPLRVGRPAGR
jgi:predicted dehydrogenase